MSRGRELYELTRVRVLLFLREPEALFWVFVFPLVLAGVLGFAFRSKGIEPARVGLLEGPGADELARALASDEHVELVRFVARAEAEKKLARAALDVLLEPQADGVPQLAYDAHRPEGENARVRVLRALDLAQGRAAAPVTLAPVEETGSRYIDFLFPGLLGMNLMGTGMWGIGFAIADVRRRKFLKRLLVTPMRRSSFFLSFILARAVFLVLELAVLGSFGAWILGVPLRGSVAAFALVSLLGAGAFAGIGILTAARARTIEAVSGLMNVVMMPMWLGSGVFFSYERFPVALQPLLKLLPLTALNDALRGVCLDGSALVELTAPLAILLTWGVLSFALALRIFRWE
ncbi:MAG: ABC transporter permease [Planctomycetes bacterium]|nr:ABC transporter permease [Planctomycetota bacterium]